MGYDKEKTLFVTDIDGTLLDNDSQLTPYTADVLREVISRGYNFTVASGRFPDSPKRIFEEHGIDLHFPIIGRNGVLIFDPKTDDYLEIHKIPRASAERVLELMRENNTPLLLVESVDERGLPKYNKRGMEGFSENPDLDNLLYLAADGPQEPLTSIYEQSLLLPGIGGVFGFDGYLPSSWCAELFSEKASKGNGVRYVAEQYGFTHTVCFGDHTNDISMLEFCDESYAPENAVEEVKAVATAVIKSNSANGVALWLEENLLR